MVGSAPSVSSTTQPTVDPAQKSLLDALAGQLGGSQGVSGALNFGQVQPSLTGQYGAPLSQLQNTSLTGIENLLNSFTGGPSTAGAGPLNQAQGTLSNAQSNPISPIGPISGVNPIDATAAFRTGVVEPLTQDFSQYTIPAITGAYGRSAGGGYSSDAEQAKQQAGTSLARTLAQSGSQFALGAAQANQGAQATNAELALRTALANQGAQATNTQLGLAGAGAVPNLLAAPGALAQQQENILTGGLQAGGVPQATEQTQLTGQYNDFQSILNQIQQKIADALGLGTAGTQQTQTVVNPGQTGILQALLGAAAKGAAGAAFA